MKEKVDIFDNLVIVKRSGQRTHFQGEKIAIAIKKAFDSIEGTYKEEDINKVYEQVLKTIEKKYGDRKTIKIEDIQDLIEITLQKKNYQDVFLSFKNYREQRNASRKAFVTKQQHKFLKTIEALGVNEKEELNYQNEKSPNELLANYGVTIAEGFAKAYLLDTKTVRAIDSGLISISHLEAIPLGSIETIELDLGRLLKEGISLSDSEQINPKNIEDYFDTLLLLIKSIANTVYGEILIQNFDHDTVPFFLFTYQESLKSEISSFFEYNGFKSFFNLERIFKEIDKITTLKDVNVSFLRLFPENEFLQLGLQKAITLAKEKSVQKTKNAYTKFLSHLNSTYDKIASFPKVSLGIGSCETEEGNILLQILFEVEKETDFLEPNYIWKLQKEKNTQLFKEFLHLSLTNQKYLFANLEFQQNQSFLIDGDISTEVCYFSDGSRVVDDITVQEARVMGGKGNLFTCSINLPRIGLKILNEKQQLEEKEFFESLDHSLDMAKDALLSCFDLLCNKHNYHFPLLLGQNIWQDGKNLKETDRIRKLLKHGTLSIHFVGLEELLFVFMNQKKAQFEKEKFSIKILKHMEEKVNSYRTLYNLNFTLSSKKKKDVCKDFHQIDTAIYGKVKGVTDHNTYSNGFETNGHSWNDTLRLEKNYHTYTNGGHLTTFPVSKKEEEQIESIFSTIQKEDFGAFSFQRKP